jgi:DNA-binding MarR family transcriptional regulator
MNKKPSEAAILVWIRLVRGQQQVLAAVESAMKAAGFPPLEWYDVLLELSREENGIRPVEIESRLLLAQHNVSRLVDRLQKAGLVERRRCKEDRRGQFVAITDEGRSLLRAMWPAYRDAIEKHLGRHFDDAEAASLAALLGRLASAPQADAPEACSAANEEPGVSRLPRTSKS